MTTAVGRGKLAEKQREEALERLRGTTNLADFAVCDLVIEAATENPEIKKRTFAELDQICPPHTILASNTSSIPVIQMSTATRRPAQVLGMHFINPVPAMRVTDYFRTLTKSVATLDPPRASC